MDQQTKRRLSKFGENIFIINNRFCGNDEKEVFYDFFKMSNVFGIHPGYVVGVLIVYDIVWIYNNRKKLSWNPLTR